MKNDKQQCNHDSLESITGFDGKGYEICHQCGYSSLPESSVKNLFQAPLSNETKVVKFDHLSSEAKVVESINTDPGQYASFVAGRKEGVLQEKIKFIKVITDRIAELQRDFTMYPSDKQCRLSEAMHILKLIQP